MLKRITANLIFKIRWHLKIRKNVWIKKYNVYVYNFFTFKIRKIQILSCITVLIVVVAVVFKIRWHFKIRKNVWI